MFNHFQRWFNPLDSSKLIIIKNLPVIEQISINASDFTGEQDSPAARWFENGWQLSEGWLDDLSHTANF